MYIYSTLSAWLLRTNFSIFPLIDHGACQAVTGASLEFLQLWWDPLENCCTTPPVLPSTANSTRHAEELWKPITHMPFHKFRWSHENDLCKSHISVTDVQGKGSVRRVLQFLQAQCSHKKNPSMLHVWHWPQIRKWNYWAGTLFSIGIVARTPLIELRLRYSRNAVSIGLLRCFLFLCIEYQLSLTLELLLYFSISAIINWSSLNNNV